MPDERTRAEIEGDLCIAVAMMATAMEDHGAMSLKVVLERETVARSVQHARGYLRTALGLSGKESGS